MWPRRMLEGDALDREVVRLGGARGEDDLVGLGVQRRGDGGPGAIDGRVRGVAERVAGARGVAEDVGEVGQHRRRGRADRPASSRGSRDRSARPALMPWLASPRLRLRRARPSSRARRRRAAACRLLRGRPSPRPAAPARPRALRARRPSRRSCAAPRRRRRPAPGWWLCQTSGASCSRMSRNVPLLFTLLGANVVMSIGPAQSSLCLISSHDLPSSAGFSPGRRAPQPLRAHEHPRALQLVAVERHLEIALGERRVDVVDLRRPRAAIPQHHHAGAVALRDHALELAVLDRVILDVHRQPLVGRVDATGPSAPPTTAARRRARCGSRSAARWRGASGRRRSAARGPWPAAPGPRASSPAGSGERLKLRFVAIGLERHAASCIVPAVPRRSRYAVACHDGRRQQA